MFDQEIITALANHKGKYGGQIDFLLEHGRIPNMWRRDERLAYLKRLEIDLCIICKRPMSYEQLSPFNRLRLATVAMIFDTEDQIKNLGIEDGEMKACLTGSQQASTSELVKH